MQQSFLSQRLKKAAQGSLCGLLAVLLSASPPLEAANHDVNDETGLQNIPTNTNANDTVTITGDITFLNSNNAIVLNKTGLTIQGAGSGGNFGTNIGSVSDVLSTAATDASFTAWVNGWNNTFNTTYLGGGIVGENTPRNKTSTASNQTQRIGDTTKWLTTPEGNESAANGLSLQNLRLGNVDVEYHGNRYVNGLIGNNFHANEDISMGDISGNAFTEINIFLESADANATHYLAGGGVVGIRATGETVGSLPPPSANAEMGDVSGNLFDNIEIITTGNDVVFANNIYIKGADEPSTYLEGGGLVGVNAVSTPGNVQGHATMNSLANNYFTNVHILSNDVLMGGGLVGLNNNSKHENTNPDWALSTADPTRITTFARLDNATGNIFGNGNGTLGDPASYDINVQVGYSLRGGGVLGLNGLSSAQVELHNLTENAFAGINVETGSYLRGGGIVGLQTNDGIQIDPDDQAALAILGNASNNLFLNEQISVGTYLEGGGVIGLRSNKGRSVLVGLMNNVFKDIDVDVTYNDSPSATPNSEHALSGGGIVGLSSAEAVNLGTVSGNSFVNISVDSTNTNANPNQGNLFGGGIIGVHALNPSNVFAEAMIEKNTNPDSPYYNKGIEANTFVNINVAAATLNGGGIIGAANANGLSAIQDVRNNTFTDQITITTAENLVGGGIIGVWAADAVDSSSNYVPALAVIESIANNQFLATVNVGNNLIGGGIIGARSNNAAMIESISNNEFNANKINVTGYIDGGGIIGITGSAAVEEDHDPVAVFKSINSSSFTNNNVTAGGMVMGGLVYSYGLANDSITGSNGLTINNSRFVNNTMTSNTDTVYGTVTIDTGVVNYSMSYDANNPRDPSQWTFTGPTTEPHTVTLTADSGNMTVFDENAITDTHGTRYNSLYMGTIPDPTGTPGNNDDPAGADAKLIVNPAAGGVVALYDPLEANQENDTTTQYTFDMEMNGDGHFVWGGENAFTLTNGATGTIELLDGTTTLLDGNSTTTDANIGLDVNNMTDRYTMSLIAPNHTFHLGNQARLNVEGHNRFDFSAATKPANSAIVELDGHLHFNLNNTKVYERGQTPDAGGARQTLLTISAPNGAQGVVDLSQSTVTLSNEFVSDRYLKDGDRFYLIEVQNGTTDDPDNKAFVGDYARNRKASSMRQGTTVSYNFILDTNGDNDNVEQNTRYFVARLEDVKPSGDFDVPNNGRTTTVTFLQHGSDRLYDPLYDFAPDPYQDQYQDQDQNCDPCAAVEPCEPISKNPSSWVRTPFASVGGVWYRANSGADSYSDVNGTIFHGGLAAQRRMHNGRIYLGAFVDTGDANYGTYNYVSSSNSDYRGNGELESLGGGVLLRRKWNNGLRFDAMFRGGNIDQSLFSSDLLVDGKPIAASLGAAYWGGDIGLGREWKNRRDAILVFSRYSWMHEEGGKADFSTNEHVVFDALNSHRLITGVRWTQQRNSMLSWYLGAAYEHEFDGASRAAEYHSGSNLVLEGLSLRGGSGIGEIGWIIKSDNRFYLTTGLEGYAGKREGGSGFVSAQWKW